MFGLFLNGGHNKRELVETYKLEFSFFFKMEFVFRMKRPVMSHMEDYPRCGPTVFVFIRSTSLFFFLKKLSLLSFCWLVWRHPEKVRSRQTREEKKKNVFLFSCLRALQCEGHPAIERQAEIFKCHYENGWHQRQVFLFLLSLLIVFGPFTKQILFPIRFIDVYYSDD